MDFQLQKRDYAEESIRLEEALREYKAGLDRQSKGLGAQDDDVVTIRRVTLLKCCLWEISGAIDCLPAGSELFLKHVQNGNDNKWRIEVSSADGRFLGTLPANKDQVTARLMDAGKAVGCRVIDETDSEYDLLFRNRSAENMRIFVEVYLKVSAKVGKEQDE